MYTYGDLIKDVALIDKKGADTGIIGYSELGNEIPYIRIGKKSDSSIIVTGGIHARENSTVALSVMQAFYEHDKNLDGYIYFIPMINPDGALLREYGLRLFSLEKYRAFKDYAELLLKINGSGDFSLYKANINGVDLNVNFDARWGTGSSNIFTPSSENYVGTKPFSESEAKALRDFTLKINPDSTISYHSKGRELYWYFYQNHCSLARDRDIAVQLNKKLRYKILDGAMGSAGGYKDWCISKLGIPSYTIEIINDKYSHPVPDKAVKEDWEQNKDIPRILLKAVQKIKSTKI